MTGCRPQASLPRGRERDEASGSPAAGVGRELGLRCCLRLFRVTVTAAQSTLPAHTRMESSLGRGSLEAGKRQGCGPALSLPPEEAPGGSGRAGPWAELGLGPPRLRRPPSLRLSPGMAEDMEVQRSDFTPRPGVRFLPAEPRRLGFQAASQVFPMTVEHGACRAITEPRLLPFLSRIFPLPRWFSFFAALLSLSLWPPAPCPPLPTAHASLGPGVPTERLFHAEERVTIHGQSGETPAQQAAGFLRRPRGLGSAARGEVKVSLGVEWGWAGGGPCPWRKAGQAGRGAPGRAPGQGEAARGAPCPGVGAG